MDKMKPEGVAITVPSCLLIPPASFVSPRQLQTSHMRIIAAFRLGRGGFVGGL